MEKLNGDSPPIFGGLKFGQILFWAGVSETDPFLGYVKLQLQPGGHFHINLYGTCRFSRCHFLA